MKEQAFLSAGMRGGCPSSYMGHLIANTWALTPPGTLLPATRLYCYFFFNIVYIAIIRIICKRTMAV